MYTYQYMYSFIVLQSLTRDSPEPPSIHNMTLCVYFLSDLSQLPHKGCQHNDKPSIGDLDYSRIFIIAVSVHWSDKQGLIASLTPW